MRHPRSPDQRWRGHAEQSHHADRWPAPCERTDWPLSSRPRWPGEPRPATGPSENRASAGRRPSSVASLPGSRRGRQAEPRVRQRNLDRPDRVPSPSGPTARRRPVCRVRTRSGPPATSMNRAATGRSSWLCGRRSPRPETGPVPRGVAEHNAHDRGHWIEGDGSLNLLQRLVQSTGSAQARRCTNAARWRCWD